MMLWMGFDTKRLAERYRRAAAIRGLPRGLLWMRCEPTGSAVFRGSIAFLPMVAYFEPVTGSEMEANPLSREPRPIVAVFERRWWRWVPKMPPIFNLTIEQVLARVSH